MGLIIFLLIIGLPFFLVAYAGFKKNKNLEKEKAAISVEKAEEKQQNDSLFICNIEQKCWNKDISDIVQTMLYFKEISKDELYDGLKDDEIEIKTYEINNLSIPCELSGNEERKVFEIIYKDHHKDTYIGDVPTKFNDKLTEIINNKNIISGNIRIKNGKYKEEKNNKILTKYDPYEIKLFIKYK